MVQVSQLGVHCEEKPNSENIVLALHHVPFVLYLHQLIS